MTGTSADLGHAVVIVGVGGTRAAAKLRQAGITDIVILDDAGASVFDDDTNGWTVTASDGKTYHGRVLIAAAGSSLHPWIPDLAGRDDFRGVSFHSVAYDPDFDPAGKRIAIVGADATASRLIPQLTESAASVKVFQYGLHRIVPNPYRTRHRVLRRLRGAPANTGRAHPWPKAELVASDVDAVTSSGIRTRDGVDHGADAIIYGTGLAATDALLAGANGLTIQQAWSDGTEPYYGVAVHGFPNYFLITDPDFGAQAGYILDCLALMQSTGSTRMEVRRSSQQLFNERLHTERQAGKPPRSAFELSSGTGVDDDVYDGAATLRLADTPVEVRVRLSGYVNPIDGLYHWQGTIFDRIPDKLLNRTQAVTLTVDGRSAPARIAARTPQGNHSVVGVGAPPFATQPTTEDKNGSSE